MRSTPLKRRPRKLRGPSGAQSAELSRLESRAHDLFSAAARDQLVCASCGSAGPWHPHHVVREQDLIKEGIPRFNAMNALRLCLGCHYAHHHPGVNDTRLPVRKLTDANLNYALWMLGGLRAVDYLRRYYNDTSDPDPRLASHAYRLADHAARRS